MKIVFTELPTTGGKIQVSFDGGSTFKDYNVTEIKVSGIPLDDNQDFEKIQIKGPSSVLKNLNVLRKISIPSQSEFVGNNDTLIIDKSIESYPDCIVGVIVPDGIKRLNSFIISLYYDYYYGSFSSYPNLQTVELPSSLSEIGEGVFKECRKIKELKLPDGIIKIGKETFKNCENLTSINIPNSVTSIGEDAFGGCSSLTSIEIPSSVTSISSNAFDNCRSLKSLSIQKGVKEIAAAAFFNCYKLSSINIPDSVIKIGNGAFCNCEEVEGPLTIPNSVTSIGDGAFDGCPKITTVTIPSSTTSIVTPAFRGCERIIVEGNNKNYSSREGSLYNKDQSILLEAHCTISTMTVPDSVTEIGKRAFCGNRKLSTIEIPDSVISIGEEAFSYCEKLATINYKGSESQWKTIKKGSRWNEKCPSDMVINYNYQG